MARATRDRTKYPGIYKRVIHAGDGSKGRIVYDIKIKNTWPSVGVHTNLEDARRDRERLLGEAARGITVGSRMTVEEFAERHWLPRLEAELARDELRASTLAEYRSALRAHVLPKFGTTRLGDVQPLDVQGFCDALTRDGKAPYTVLNILKPLRSLLDHAKRARLIPYNPAAEIDPPKAKRKRDPQRVTLADVWRLADAAPTTDDRNLVLVAASTGLRASELYGLRWTSVYLGDDRPARLIVEEQYYQGTHVERAKSRSGNREVLLAPEAVDALRSQLASTRPNPDGLVFPSVEGSYVRASNWNRRVWQPTRSAAGLPELHFHDLRAFYISSIRSTKLPTAWTMQLVGHSDDRTHDGYTHTLPGAEDAISKGLAGLFTRPTDETVSST